MGRMTIGEFASAAGLTPKALRLYDDLGLLAPASVDPHSGYRHYDPAQLDRARLVAALRRVGMPLARIGVVADLPPDGAAADVAAWWRQVEHDTADRRALVAALLARFTEETTMDTTTTTAAPVTVRSAHGLEQGARAVQQDAVATAHDRAVIADGFHDHGERAAAAVAEEVLAAVGPDPLATLRAGFAAAARRCGATDGEHGGTTATALCCDGARVGIVHVGDSRAYLLRDGVLTRLTVDHSRVATLVEEGRLTPEEAVEHPDRPRLVRALGTHEPDVHVRAARPGDRYLLCTDGVWTLLDDAALARALGAPEPADVVVGTLLDAARAADAPDNAACAVVDLV